MDFVLHAWNEFINSIIPLRLPTWSPRRWTRGHPAIIICIGDLHAYSWFGIVEKLDVDVLLVTKSINWCICRLFLGTEHRILLLHWRSLVTTLTKVEINSITADDTVLNVKVNVMMTLWVLNLVFSAFHFRWQHPHIQMRLYWYLAKALGSWPLDRQQPYWAPIFHEWVKSNVPFYLKSVLRLHC